VSPNCYRFSTDRVTAKTDNASSTGRGTQTRAGVVDPGQAARGATSTMETFHGFDFDTMTEIPAEAGRRLGALDPADRDEDVSFVRGLWFGLLFAVPGWVLLAVAVLAFR
jgi:hypothetical protein